MSSLAGFILLACSPFFLLTFSMPNPVGGGGRGGMRMTISAAVSVTVIWSTVLPSSYPGALSPLVFKSHIRKRNTKKTATPFYVAHLLRLSLSLPSQSTNETQLFIRLLFFLKIFF